MQGRQRWLWAEIGRLGPGPDRATQARVRRERRCLCRAPGAQTAAAQGSPEPSAIFTAWQQSLAGVKLCKPSEKSDKKKLRSVVRFAFHQIVLSNSIQNLHSDSRLTDAIDERRLKKPFQDPYFRNYEVGAPSHRLRETARARRRRRAPPANAESRALAAARD